MASSQGGINGIGLGVAAVGGLLVYAGIRHVPILSALRDLAQGRAPVADVQAPYQPVDVGAYVGGALAGGGIDAAVGGAVAAAVLHQADRYRGRCYRFGGGHGGSGCSGCVDCSGFASCVLQDVGILKRGESMTTDGFAGWKGATTVPYEQRAAGDLIIWNGGPGGGHMGIVVDRDRMINNPCRRCGGVKIATYSSGTYRARPGRMVRRITAKPVGK